MSSQAAEYIPLVGTRRASSRARVIGRAPAALFVGIVLLVAVIRSTARVRRESTKVTLFVPFNEGHRLDDDGRHGGKECRTVCRAIGFLYTALAAVTAKIIQLPCAETDPVCHHTKDAVAFGAIAQHRLSEPSESSSLPMGVIETPGSCDEDEESDRVWIR